MKKILLLIAAAVMSCCAFAQSRVIVGDMNGDGKLTVDDVALLTDDILHDRFSAYYTDCEFIYSRDGEYHEWVDLGLPSGTLWATCNIGASKPEEYGDYFAWGETAPQADNAYTWSSYSLCKGSYSTMTKYCNQSGKGYNGYTDELTELEAYDDAATVNWGKEWQIPSKEQIKEIYNSSYTNTEWTTINGINGYKITSKKEGYTDQYIFLPAAGYRVYNHINSVSTYGYYWSRSLDTQYPQFACYLNFFSGSTFWSSSYRCEGRSVRPVRKDDFSVVMGVAQANFATYSDEEILTTFLPRFGDGTLTVSEIGTYSDITKDGDNYVISDTKYKLNKNELKEIPVSAGIHFDCPTNIVGNTTFILIESKYGKNVLEGYIDMQIWDDMRKLSGTYVYNNKTYDVFIKGCGAPTLHDYVIQ